MIYKVTSVYRRQDVTAKWHGEIALDEELEQQVELYKLANVNGKHVKNVNRPDDHTVVIETFWESKELYDAYRAEPVVARYFDLVNQYFASVGITAEPQIKEYIEGSLG